MKCLIAMVFALWTAISASCAESWTFHFEAEKGETRVEISADPVPLEKLIFEAPSYSPDPIVAGASIAEARVRKLGAIAACAILEVRLRIRGDYYTHVYLLLAEVEPGRYLPIYGQQYAQGVRRPTLVGSSFHSDRASLEVRMDHAGTGAFRFSDQISVNFGADQKLSATTVRR